MKIALIKPLKILIKPDVYQDIVDIVTGGNEEEVAWFHTVVREDNLFTLTNTFFPEQICSGTHNDMTAHGQYELLEFEDKSEGNVLCWGHSHVDMPVTPSSLDDATLQEYFDDKYPFYVRLITNKKLVMNISVFTQEFVAHDVPFEVLYPSRKDYWLTQLKEKCQVYIKPWTTYRSSKYYNPRSYQTKLEKMPDTDIDIVDDDYGKMCKKFREKYRVYPEIHKTTKDKKVVETTPIVDEMPERLKKNETTPLIVGKVQITKKDVKK